MQMPCLIDLLRGCHRVPGNHRQRDEALVFEDHPARENHRPSLLPCQPRCERQLHTRLIGLEGHDPLQKFLVSDVTQTASIYHPPPDFRNTIISAASPLGIAEAAVLEQIPAPMNASPDPTRREAPWMAGLRAARANLIPALVVQGVMLAVVIGYYFLPPVTAWLNVLADLKSEWGYGYSALAAAIAGGIIPELMRIIFFQKGKPRRFNASNLLFTIPFWSGTGMVVDLFYRSQAEWFGDEATVGVVVTKVLVDQFVYNPLFAGPSGAWCYDWKHSGYSFRNIGRFFTLRYYRNVIIPILFATWGVWIPLVAIIYSLPSVLQIPLFALALAMWVMLYTWISEHRQAS